MEKTKNTTEPKTFWRIISFNANSGFRRMVHKRGFHGINMRGMVKFI
jgi:hypothetical protein